MSAVARARCAAGTPRATATSSLGAMILTPRAVPVRCVTDIDRITPADRSLRTRRSTRAAARACRVADTPRATASGSLGMWIPTPGAAPARCVTSTATCAANRSLRTQLSTSAAVRARRVAGTPRAAATSSLWTLMLTPGAAPARCVTSITAHAASRSLRTRRLTSTAALNASTLLRPVSRRRHIWMRRPPMKNDARPRDQQAAGRVAVAPRFFGRSANTGTGPTGEAS